ncbi:kinase-like protein, partial [Clavulina sp. PMI_390]
FTHTRCRQIITKAVAAVSEIHAAGVVHGDLKFDHFLVDYQDQLYLIDFGLAVRPQAGQLFTYSLGTESYKAPEVKRGRPYSPFAADIYALGQSLRIILLK